MSHKNLTFPSSQTKPSKFFYKADQIRFKGFVSRSFKRLPRQEYVFSQSPWLSLKEDQMGQLIERLQDGPEQLYNAIEKRERRTKFRLLANRETKQNDRLMSEIELKKRKYEQQFRSILQHRKSQTLTILLPKLDGIRYVFGDKLHRLTMQTNSLQ